MARLSYYPEGLNDPRMRIIRGATVEGAAGGECFSTSRAWATVSTQVPIRLSDCPDTYGRKFGAARAANMPGCAGSASGWGVVMSAWRLPGEMADWVTQAGNHDPFGKKICRYVPGGGAPSLCRALPSLTPGLVSRHHRLW